MDGTANPAIEGDPESYLKISSDLLEPLSPEHRICFAAVLAERQVIPYSDEVQILGPDGRWFDLGLSTLDKLWERAKGKRLESAEELLQQLEQAALLVDPDRYRSGAVSTAIRMLRFAIDCCVSNGRVDDVLQVAICILNHAAASFTREDYEQLNNLREQWTGKSVRKEAIFQRGLMQKLARIRQICPDSVDSLRQELLQSDS